MRSDSGRFALILRGRDKFQVIKEGLKLRGLGEEEGVTGDKKIKDLRGHAVRLITLEDIQVRAERSHESHNKSLMNKKDLLTYRSQLANTAPLCFIGPNILLLPGGSSELLLTC